MSVIKCYEDDLYFNKLLHIKFIHTYTGTAVPRASTTSTDVGLIVGSTLLAFFGLAIIVAIIAGIFCYTNKVCSGSDTFSTVIF